MKQRLFAWVLFFSVFSGGFLIASNKVHAATLTSEFTNLQLFRVVDSEFTTGNSCPQGMTSCSGVSLTFKMDVTNPSTANIHQQNSIPASSFYYLEGYGEDPMQGVYLEATNAAGSVIFSQALYGLAHQTIDTTQANDTITFGTGPVLPAGQTITFHARVKARLGPDTVQSNDVPITTPATNTGVGTSGGFVSGNSQSVDNSDANLVDAVNCSLFGEITGCLIKLYYSFIYQPSAVIVTLVGWLFDAFLNFSISSFMYSQSSFVLQGWSIVRDIANLFFIFMLIFTGVKLILGQGDSSVKKTIGILIVVALLINFSLFMTRVVIDAGNILARVFYTQITFSGHASAGVANTSVTGIDEVHISEGLSQGLNIQKIISRSTLQTLQANGGLADSAAFLIITLGIVVNLVAAWTFFICAFLMVARIIGLWFTMIFAPLAFVSNVVPQLKGVDWIGWDKWLKNLLNLSFLAPIFIFFMYVIILFIQSRFLEGLLSTSTAGDNTSFLSADFVRLLTGILLQFMIIIALIGQARKFAEKLAGEAGAGFVTAAKWAGGLAVGAATGGAALLGRASIGRIAAGAAESSAFKDAASKKGVTGFMARRALTTTKSIGNATFDARNTKAGAAASKGTGANFGKVESKGYIKDRDDRIKKEGDFAKSLQVSGFEKRDFIDAENEERRLQNIGKDNIDPRTGTVVTQEALDAAKRKREEEDAKIKTTNLERRQNYADTVEQGTGIDYVFNRMKAGVSAVATDFDDLTTKLTTAENQLTVDKFGQKTEEDNLKRLKDLKVGTIDPTTGQPITQQNITDAEDRVKVAKSNVEATADHIYGYRTEISKAGRGKVMYENEAAANDIRKGPKLDTSDQKAVNDKTVELLQKLVDSEKTGQTSQQNTSGGTTASQPQNTQNIPPTPNPLVNNQQGGTNQQGNPITP